MKSLIVASALLVLAVPANARMRHDRPCDLVQDKFEVFSPIYNPDHAHFVRFGTCEGYGFDDTPDGFRSLADYWGSISCGYQAYREGKKLTGSLYKNLENVAAWKAGWKIARKACTADRLPNFDRSDAE